MMKDERGSTRVREGGLARVYKYKLLSASCSREEISDMGFGGEGGADLESTRPNFCVRLVGLQLARGLPRPAKKMAYNPPLVPGMEMSATSAIVIMTETTSVEESCSSLSFAWMASAPERRVRPKYKWREG
jgi:hypothetical protein